MCVRFCQCAIAVTLASQRMNTSSDEGKEVLAYQGPRVIAPDELAAMSRAVTCEPITSGSSSTSVDRLFVSADISTDAEED